MLTSQVEKNLYARLIGYVGVGQVVLINDQLCEVLTPVNVYVYANKLVEEIRKAGMDEDKIRKDTYSGWLSAKGYVRCLTARESSVVSTADSYCTYPFYPSYKDVLWVARVLKFMHRELTPRDVYILAVYRGMEIENTDVDQTVLSRSSEKIKTLLAVLEGMYLKHAQNFLNNNGKEAHNEPGSSHVPSA